MDTSDVKPQSLPAPAKEESEGGVGVKAEPSGSTVDEDAKSGDVKHEKNGGTLPPGGEPDTGEEEIEDEAEDEEEDGVVEETHLPVTTLYKEPAYAQLCSFFNLYSSLLSMKQVAFPKLEKMFTILYNGEADKDLIELHVTMMRKIYLKSARADKWESSLLKFCSICPSLEMELRQLQRCGYSELPMASKLSIARALCESQFDCNVKFKENVFNTYTAQEMRLAPIGSDKLGQSYFYQQDCDLNIRVYTVEPDDGAGTTWQLRAGSQPELLSLISELRAPEFGTNSQVVGATSDDAVAEEKHPVESGLDDKVVSMCDKWALYWDLFKEPSLLNKKKLEKEKRQKVIAQHDVAEDVEGRPEIGEGDENGGAPARVGSPPLQEEEDDFDPTPFLDDDRRVLPRRSARTNAMINLKAFTASPAKRDKKNATAEKDAPASSAKQKPAAKEKSPSLSDSNAGSSDDEDEQESEEERESDEDRNENSSDADFDPDSPVRANAVRGYGGLPEKRRPKKGDDGGGVAKKKRRGRLAKKAKGGKKAAICFDIGRLKKQQKESAVSTVESSSSDDEANDEEEKLKERKKATEKSLCMYCNGSKRPDLLLLCDLCDDPWHTYCLNPKLWYVPDGDWFCPKCEHQRLIERLSFALAKLREQSKAKEEEEVKRRQEVANRLKKEMDWIGSQISLTNIIPNSRGTPPTASSEDEEDEVEDGQRKSKRRAMKKVMAKGTRRRLAHEQFERFYGPVVTIAEGRSRREVKRVDYNFQAYEEQLKEAMVEDDCAGTRANDSPGPSGLGKGKDMANIINADLKRRASIEEESRIDDALPARPPSSLRQALPPSKKPGNAKQRKKRRRKKLTDLDVDNATESSSTDAEYNAMSDECRQEEDPEPSEDEYLPREFQKRGPRGRIGPTRSDEEFIDDHSLSDSDYEVGSSSQRRRQKARGVGRRQKGRKRAHQYDSDESDESEDDYQGESDESYRVGKKKKGRFSAGIAVPPQRKPKWTPKAVSSTSNEDEEELEAPSDESEERTETGRPLRRAAAEMKQKIKEIEDLDHELAQELDEEGEAGNKDGETANGGTSQQPVGSLTRLSGMVGEGLQPRKIVSDEEDEADEFRPDEEDEEASDESEDEGEDEDGHDKEHSEEGLRSHGRSKPGTAATIKTELTEESNDAKNASKGDTRAEQRRHEDQLGQRSASVLDSSGGTGKSAQGQCDQPNACKTEVEVGEKSIVARISSQPMGATTTPHPPQLSTRHCEDRKPTISAPEPALSNSTLRKSLVPANPTPLNLPVVPAKASPAPRSLTLASMRPIVHQTNTTYHTFPASTTAPPYFVPVNAIIPPVGTGAGDYAGGQQPRSDAATTRPQLPTPHYPYHNTATIHPPQPFFPNIGAYGNQHTAGEPQFVVDPRTGQLVDANSLGQALAGAMNPEDL